MLRIAVGELDPGLLPPKEIGDEADKARLREFMGVLAHGVVHAPDFHDRDDAARRRAVRDGRRAI